MWEISNDSQVLNFIFAIGLGLAFCFLYDILRAFRGAFDTSALALFLQDLVFFSISAFITFCFLLITTNGEVRLYIILGIACGFLTLRLTASKFIFMAFRVVFRTFKKSVSKVFETVLKFLKIWIVKCDIFLKNMIIKSKKVLKK